MREPPICHADCCATSACHRCRHYAAKRLLLRCSMRGATPLFSRSAISAHARCAIRRYVCYAPTNRRAPPRYHRPLACCASHATDIFRRRHADARADFIAFSPLMILLLPPCFRHAMMPLFSPLFTLRFLFAIFTLTPPPLFRMRQRCTPFALHSCSTHAPQNALRCHTATFAAAMLLFSC